MDNIIIKLELIDGETNETLISAKVSKEVLDKIKETHHVNGLFELYKNLLIEITENK